MAKYSINLLQDDLIPPKVLWSLNRVVSLWGGVFTVMLLILFYAQYQSSNLSTELNTLNNIKNSSKNKIKNLEFQVSKVKKNDLLVTKLNTLKLMNENTKSLLQQLTDPKQTYSAGFSSVMTSLAQLHNNNISLQGVRITNGNFTFSGIARVPDAVPNWLTGFESSTFLSGKSFIHFELSENKEKLTKFVVSTTVARGKY